MAPSPGRSGRNYFLGGSICPDIDNPHPSAWVMMDIGRRCDPLLNFPETRPASACLPSAPDLSFWSRALHPNVQVRLHVHLYRYTGYLFELPIHRAFLFNPFHPTARLYPAPRLSPAGPAMTSLRVKTFPQQILTPTDQMDKPMSAAPSSM